MRVRAGAWFMGLEERFVTEDAELEFFDAKKQSRGSTSTKRSCAADVHNLSERRCRDRINEKMKPLQELIPRCNKSDKASMLDEAIEYLKSLQLQVQMRSMGCGMVPIMFPCVQQYMGMGMEMGMSRPMMPYPNVLAGSPLPTPGAAAHLGPRFPMPASHMQPVPGADPSRIQGANHSEHMLNSYPMQNPNQPQIANFVDPYQQYLALHQMQLPLPQVSNLGFGCMCLIIVYNSPVSDEDGISIINDAFNKGITLFDTSDAQTHVQVLEFDLNTKCHIGCGFWRYYKCSKCW